MLERYDKLLFEMVSQENIVGPITNSQASLMQDDPNLLPFCSGSDVSVEKVKQAVHTFNQLSKTHLPRYKLLEERENMKLSLKWF